MSDTPELFLEQPNMKVPTEEEQRSLEILRANILAARKILGI